MRTLRRAVLLLLVVAAAAAPARAVGPEEELGPELMALADGIVEKVIYGIRYEGLRAERVSAVIRAWTGYYIGCPMPSGWARKGRARAPNRPAGPWRARTCRKMVSR
jgi:hypothetical protein